MIGSAGVSGSNSNPTGVIVVGKGVNVESGLSSVFLIFILYNAKAPIKTWKVIKNIKNPLAPNQLINKVHSIGPPIAPIPKINCNPPPAATNFSLGTKSLVWAKFNENKGKHKPAYNPIEIKNDYYKLYFTFYMSNSHSMIFRVVLLTWPTDS